MSWHAGLKGVLLCRLEDGAGMHAAWHQGAHLWHELDAQDVGGPSATGGGRLCEQAASLRQARGEASLLHSHHPCYITRTSNSL